MSTKTYVRMIEEISRVLDGVDTEVIDKMAVRLAGGAHVFCTGVGRSGYMMRAFTMRLMHAGLNAYFVGDSSTPAAREGDVLVIGSGSGETGSLKAYAEKAEKLGVGILTITTAPDSTLGRAADICLVLTAPTPKASKQSDFVSHQPMGSLFEQCLLLTLDGLIVSVMERLGLTSGEMFVRHANLE